MIARVHPTDGRIEFAVQHELDLDQRSHWDEDYSDPVFTRKRFFPSDVSHHRWLYSTHIRFTRTFAEDSMMEAPATLSRRCRRPSGRLPDRSHWSNAWLTFQPQRCPPKTAMT